MLLTISTTHQPATDLGFLLHKHPDKFQSVDLSIVMLIIGLNGRDWSLRLGRKIYAIDIIIK